MSIGVCQAKQKSKSKPQIDPAQKNAEFQQLFASLFAQWDSNHDGKLDLEEVNAAIQNPQVRGNEAAVAVVLHPRLKSDDDDETNSLSLPQVLAFADDPKMQKTIIGRAQRIQTMDHSLFLPGDPNLLNFHQGRMGDCYLLAAIGSFVYQNPQTVRSMIKPLADGGYAVQFGDGKTVAVGAMTDGELLLGASEGHSCGYWLCVLQKAYAELRKDKKEGHAGHEFETNETIFADFIGHGGTCAPVMAAFTGHQTTKAPIKSWRQKDPATAIEKTHEFFATLASQHRVMTVGTGGDKTIKLPKGIAHKHAYGILDYNPTTRMVRMFNPWGNQRKPSGPPGLVNGYVTEHGVFEIPLADFIQVYGGFTYETDKPVKSAP